MTIPLFRDVRTKRGVGFATNEQIVEFLRCVWIERIWTFQELTLANNPVIVRGSCHLSWPRLVISFVFYVASHGSTYSNNVVLRQWLDLIIDRVCVQDALNDLSTVNTQYVKLQNYCIFVGRLIRSIAIIRICLAIFSALLFLILTGTFIATVSLKGAFQAVMALCGATIFSILFAMSQFVPNPPLHPAFDQSAAQQLSYKPTTAHTVFHALRVRKAKDPKDMSFGLHSVLRKITDKDLPRVDYQVSTGTAYRQLTHYLIAEYESLDLLLLAAQAHLKDAPSWVPDFSQTLDAVFDGGSHLASQWGIDKTGSESLIVRGALVDTIAKAWQIKTTKSTYLESEWAEHTENIRILQCLMKQSSTALSYDVLENMFALSTSSPLLNFQAYFNLLWRMRFKKPSTVLSLFLSSKLFYSPRTSWWLSYSKMFSIHLEFCELMCSRYSLVQLDEQLCFLPIAVEKGDRIAIIQGISEPLVVRPCGKSVRLVSRTTASVVGILDSPNIKWKMNSLLRWPNLLGFAYIEAKTKNVHFKQMSII